MNKQTYTQPSIEKVSIDNEISVVLMSIHEPGPSGNPLNLPPPPDQG